MIPFKKYRTHIVKLHLLLIIIEILNLIAISLFETGSVEWLSFTFKILIFLTGVISFFMYIRPFRIISMYFSIYTLSVFLLVFGFIIRGIPGALIISIIGMPLVPDQKIHSTDGIIIYRSFEGMMASCCTYEIRKKRAELFEKRYQKFEDGLIDFREAVILNDQKKITVTYFSGKENKQVKKVFKK